MEEKLTSVVPGRRSETSRESIEVCLSEGKPAGRLCVSNSCWFTECVERALDTREDADMRSEVVSAIA